MNVIHEPDDYAPLSGALCVFASPIVFMEPERCTSWPWIGHIPFGFWVMDAIRPEILVELGTHTGTSYLAFCQAVRHLRLATACFAVDTWRGDPQSGFYGEEVFAELQLYHEPRYGDFSRLIRSTFDEALGHFADQSIDLLHIDGYHLYEKVKHDFTSWLPKLSRRGVVLFHDINVREGDFGAWRLWEEISSTYPSFTFLHSHGLGVLATGPEQSAPVRKLLSLRNDDPQLISGVRRFFERLGGRLSDQLRNNEILAEQACLKDELSIQRKQNEELNALLKRNGGETSRLRTELDRRLDKIRSLEAERSQYQQDITHLQSHLGNRDELIDQLAKKVRSGTPTSSV